MKELNERTVPRLPHGVRLKFDSVRSVSILLAPERAFALDDIAAEVLRLVDGRRCVGEIVDVLAEKFAADRTLVKTDVTEMLTGLVGKRVLEVEDETASQPGFAI